MTAHEVYETDPYRLSSDEIAEPPTGWWPSVRYLGPGLIVSGSIVGSGELIATTTLGAQVGFVLLWLVVVSTLVKVAVQVELARWTISTGRPAITGFNAVPGRVGRISWVNLLLAVLALAKILQNGALVGGVAIALSFLVPIGDPLGFTSVATWTTIVVVGTIALLYSNSYRRIEAVSVALVAFFTLFTVAIALSLPFTPFAFDVGDVLGGLEFRIPAGALGAAVAMFGLTGVAAEESTTYTYWCLEKGYARRAGPNDDSDAWARRANGWLKVMYKDAILSWVVYTFSTLAFYLLGAAVLNTQGLVPGGEEEMISTLARIYSDILGDAGRVFFLLGAVAVLGSTLWVGLASWARMNTHLLSTVGLLNWSNPQTRLRAIRVFTVVLPIIWGISYLVISLPVLMVQIAGVISGIFLLAVVVAVWYLRQTQTDKRLYGGGLFNAALIVSSIAIGLLGIYSVVEVFGITIG